MELDQAFSDLVGLVYQGALDEPPFQTFLEQLQQLLSAEATTLILQPPSAGAEGIMLNVGGSSEGIAEYKRQLFVLDPFVDLPMGDVVSLREFMGEQQFLASDLYRLSLEPSNLHDIIGVDIRVENEFEARLRVCRGRDALSFSEAEKKLCLTLLAHLERAILIHARLNKMESERALYAGAVDYLAVAAILLDEAGQVVSTNERSKKLLDEADGLRQKGDSLQVVDKNSREGFYQAVERVLQRPNQGEAQPAVVEALCLPRHGRLDLGVIVRPVPVTPWAEGKKTPRVAIFISDPEQTSQAPKEVLMRLFGFTPTEATLALLLANGHTLDEAAEVLGVSRNTVRTHLRSIFNKTGVNRQTSLVRLILNSVAPLGET